MLPVGAVAPRFSPAKNIRVIILASDRTVMYITDSIPSTGLEFRTRRQGGRRSWPLQRDRVPAEEDELVIRGRAELAVCDVDRLNLVAKILEASLVRDPDLTIGLAHHSFGDAFTVTPADTPREKEGLR